MNFRSPSLLAASRELPCQSCGAHGRTQAAHNNQLKDGKGTGIKSHDFTVMSLCVECHTALDQSGKLKKNERHDFEDAMNLKTLRELIRLGYLKVAK